ncbi:hypothetical protein WJX73_008538 [Symbiochloris irregularis]|uniref:WW domain-containing protein n=1 Tax=Symbiochloris irregularis TaxID=706552 RepID=A0AAW1PG68_9CHLO
MRPRSALHCVLLLALVVLSSASDDDSIDLDETDEVPGMHEPAEPPRYYYWNEVTGKVQWDDPGDVPYEEEDGARYWFKDGEKVENNPPVTKKYSWVEGFSKDHGRAYYYNQETEESTWEKPADLAWRRVPVKPATDEL